MRMTGVFSLEYDPDVQEDVLPVLSALRTCERFVTLISPHVVNNNLSG